MSISKSEELIKKAAELRDKQSKATQEQKEHDDRLAFRASKANEGKIQVDTFLRDAFKTIKETVTQAGEPFIISPRLKSVNFFAVTVGAWAAVFEKLEMGLSLKIYTFLNFKTNTEQGRRLPAIGSGPKEDYKFTLALGEDDATWIWYASKPSDSLHPNINQANQSVPTVTSAEKILDKLLDIIIQLPTKSVRN